jgi:hypothetical protein
MGQGSATALRPSGIFTDVGGDVRAGFQTAIQEDPIRRNFYEIVSAVPVSG